MALRNTLSCAGVVIAASFLAHAQQPVARMPVSDAKVTGAVQVKDGQMEMGSGALIDAGAAGAQISLSRGGELRVCANSAVHLATGANAGEMMLSLDRGAMELRGSLGKFSDVVMTPDLRILVSGPASEDVRVRSNQQGDTCVDNVGPPNADSGADAPYVLVTEQLGTGVYRVQPGQRVMFEHGSVAAVVDHEKEPCGCPALPVSPANLATAPGANGSQNPMPDAAGAGDTSATKPGAIEFPLAQSEGLAPAPPPPTEPVVKPGEPHAQVTIPFSFDGSAPPAPAAASPVPPPAAAGSAGSAAPATTTATPAPSNSGGVWHAVKRFFGRMFHPQS